MSSSEAETLVDGMLAGQRRMLRTIVRDPGLSEEAKLTKFEEALGLAPFEHNVLGGRRMSDMVVERLRCHGIYGGLASEGRSCIIAGPPGTGKTTLACLIGWSLAHGGVPEPHPELGEVHSNITPVDGLHVLIIDCEQRGTLEDLKMHLETMGAPTHKLIIVAPPTAHPDMAQATYHSERSALSDSNLRRFEIDLSDYAHQPKVVAVIIDGAVPLFESLGKNINYAGDTTAVMSVINKISTSSKKPIMLTHHNNKQGSIMGSEMFTAAASHIVQTSKMGPCGVFLIRSTKSPLGTDLPSYVMKLRSNGPHFDLAPPPPEEQDLVAKAEKWLKDRLVSAAGEAVPAQDLDDEIEDMGISKSHLNRAKTALRKRKEIDFVQRSKQFSWFAVGFQEQLARKRRLREHSADMFKLMMPGGPKFNSPVKKKAALAATTTTSGCAEPALTPLQTGDNSAVARSSTQDTK